MKSVDREDLSIEWMSQFPALLVKNSCIIRPNIVGKSPVSRAKGSIQSRQARPKSENKIRGKIVGTRHRQRLHPRDKQAKEKRWKDLHSPKVVPGRSSM